MSALCPTCASALRDRARRAAEEALAETRATGEPAFDLANQAMAELVRGIGEEVHLAARAGVLEALERYGVRPPTEAES